MLDDTLTDNTRAVDDVAIRTALEFHLEAPSDVDMHDKGSYLAVSLLFRLESIR